MLSFGNVAFSALLCPSSTLPPPFSFILSASYSFFCFHSRHRSFPLFFPFPFRFRSLFRLRSSQPFFSPSLHFLVSPPLPRSLPLFLFCLFVARSLAISPSLLPLCLVPFHSLPLSSFNSLSLRLFLNWYSLAGLSPKGGSGWNEMETYIT